MDTKNTHSTRFFSKIETRHNGCWEWIGSKDKGGYGHFKYPTGNDKPIGAHVASYRYFYGVVPEGMEIRHTCDNPSCVNPIHLIPGTHQDNMNDMVKRGRWIGGAPKKEFCKYGHKIADDFYIVKNRKSCRKCRIAISKEFREEKKRQLNKESNNV